MAEGLSGWAVGLDRADWHADTLKGRRVNDFNYDAFTGESV